MKPRNLRKPTPRRCAAYWDDYIAAWRAVGAAAAQHLSDPGPPEDMLAAMIIEAARGDPTRRAMTREEIKPWIESIGREHAENIARIGALPEYDGPFWVAMGLRTVDAHWTRFVRAWRNMTRRLFLPRCSRSEPCCENECENLAEHFARTGEIP